MSQTRQYEMKDSGVEWIGEIPKEWELERLKWILAERKEKNDPQKTDFILSLGAAYGVVPYSEKKGGGNKAKGSLTDYNLAYPNDIVLNSMNIISGSVGLSKYYGCVSPVYYILYPYNSTYSSVFFCYLFQTIAFQRSLLGLGNGILIKESSTGTFNTVRMRIPMEKLGVQLLPVPPVEQQKIIAAYLDDKCASIDSIIAEAKASIEEYKTLKASIIYEAVTKGLDPNAEMKDSGVDWIGKIPKGWKIISLRYFGTCQNGISKGGESFGYGFPFVSYPDVYKNITLPEEVSQLVDSTRDERERYSVKYGDIFFTRTSETIEEIGFSSVCLKTIENATFAGFLIRFRPTNNQLFPGYSKYYFRSEIQRRYFVKEMILVTRASLGQTLLKSMSVILPPVEEQTAIAAYLDDKCATIDAVIAEKESLISELETYKKSLIFETVTGKRRIC